MATNQHQEALRGGDPQQSQGPYLALPGPLPLLEAGIGVRAGASGH
jgi:hypothetical protein